MNLERAIAKSKRLRSIGFDDAPFDKLAAEAPVRIAGVVCASTRFEGMVWGTVARDGDDATEVVLELLSESKFLPQLHLALFDGIAFGGFNIIDLPRLHAELDLPVVAVMRNEPDLAAVREAQNYFDDTDRRLDLLDRAGPIHAARDVYFQVAGATPEVAADAIARVTHTGHIPEPIRLAHLIGSAVLTGESGRRA